MSMTLSDYLKTKNGKDAARLARKYYNRKSIPANECFTYTVFCMVYETVFGCDDSGYDDWVVEDAVAALSGEQFHKGILSWIQNAPESADILSITADDARYDGMWSLFHYLLEMATEPDGEKESPTSGDSAEADTPARNISETTEKYWDCGCAENYIHPADETHCDRCGCDRDDCPDSRTIEVAMAGLPL